MKQNKSNAQYIHTLFQNTHNGQLTLTHYPENGAPEYTVTYSVSWDRVSVDLLAERFAQLRGRLEQIGLIHDSLAAFIEADHVPNTVLNEELLAVWDTYIAPFGPSGLDEEAIETLNSKLLVGEELTQQEQLLWDKYRDWFEQRCLERLPRLGCSPVNLINRARRYEKLVHLHAPQVILDNEARLLAEAMVLYYCKTL